MLGKVFVKKDRERILQIPLSLQATKDRLFWAHSASGEDTVKSGYRSAQERKIGRRVRNSHEESGCRNEVNARGWKVLWQLNMKHKLKHFIWKCMKGILPVNKNIKTGSMQSGPLYKCCEVVQSRLNICCFYVIM